jgi:hypothetical protein
MVKVAGRSQADHRPCGRLIIVPIALLRRDASPPPLHQDVVPGTSPSLHTALHACGLHAAGNIAAGTRRALIAMQDRWRAYRQSPLDCLYATPTRQRDGHRPRPHLPAAPIQHRDHLHTPRTPPDRRDVRTPDVMHAPPGPPAPQGRRDARPRGRPARAWRGIDGRHAQDPQPPRSTRGMHRISLGLEPGRHAAHSITWRPWIRLLPQAHHLEVRRARAHGSIVHPGPWHAQPHTRPGPADRGRCRFAQAPLGLSGQVQRVC